ncbi:hypothetical protein AGLY_017953 [Aphis glycines]|uniref:Uncharacterized protein n=1 Tax=Aphis glycines TaxID=307491 RepID=A0A6G0SVH4_APHGL|nr:hypothetical protein AGLY_017953 [Aphis glycines]
MVVTQKLITHQGYSLFHRKPPPKFEIEALFRQIRCEYNLDLNPINSVIIFPFNSSLNLPKTFLLTKGDSSEIPITSKLFRLLTHLKSPVEIAISSFCIQLKNSLATFGPEYSTGEISFVLLTNFGTSVVFTGNSIPFNSLSKSFFHFLYFVTLCGSFSQGCKAEINDRPDRDSNPGPLD